MTAQSYFSAAAVAIATPVAIAGAALLAANVARDAPSARFVIPEPALSIGLLFVYGPLAYALGGVVGLVANWNAALPAALFIFGIGASLHVGWLVGRRRRDSRAPEIASSATPSRDDTSILHPSADSDELRSVLRQALRHSPQIRVLANNAASVLDGDGAIGGEIRGALQQKSELAIITAASTPLSSLPHNHIDMHTVDAAVLAPFTFVMVVNNWVFAQLDPEEAIHVGHGDALDPLLVAARILATVAFSAGPKLARLKTCSTPQGYKDLIIAAESGARQISRLPKRISVVFKSEETVRQIAELRFGPGSESTKHYVNEHRERRAQFFQGLATGLHCREVYSIEELTAYVRSREHSSVTLPKNVLKATLERWRDTILTCPNYIVALTEDPLPFKYALIDDQIAIMHEALGVTSRHRLNAICIEGEPVERYIREDFELIWDAVPDQRRQPDHVAEFINDELISLLQEDPADNDREVDCGT